MFFPITKKGFHSWILWIKLHRKSIMKLKLIESTKQLGEPPSFFRPGNF